MEHELKDILTPEKCHELRENDFLQLLVYYLHEHTIEIVKDSIQENALSWNVIEEGYLQKAQMRRKLSKVLRHIITTTSKDPCDLQILDCLEGLRLFVEELFIKKCQSPSCSSHLCEQLMQINQILDKDLWKDLCGRNIFPEDFEMKEGSYAKSLHMLGGIHVLLDVIQIEHRFHNETHTDEHCVALRYHALNILYDAPNSIVFFAPFPRADICDVLSGHRTFISLLLDLLKKTHIKLVDQTTNIAMLNIASMFLYRLMLYMHGESSSISQLEVIKCLIETAMLVKDQEILSGIVRLINVSYYENTLIVPGAVEFFISLFAKYYSHEKKTITEIHSSSEEDEKFRVSLWIMLDKIARYCDDSFLDLFVKLNITSIAVEQLNSKDAGLPNGADRIPKILSRRLRKAGLIPESGNQRDQL